MTGRVRVSGGGVSGPDRPLPPPVGTPGVGERTVRVTSPLCLLFRHYVHMSVWSSRHVAHRVPGEESVPHDPSGETSHYDSRLSVPLGHYVSPPDQQGPPSLPSTVLVYTPHPYLGQIRVLSFPHRTCINLRFGYRPPSPSPSLFVHRPWSKSTPRPVYYRGFCLCPSSCAPPGSDLYDSPAMG